MSRLGEVVKGAWKEFLFGEEIGGNEPLLEDLAVLFGKLCHQGLHSVECSVVVRIEFRKGNTATAIRIRESGLIDMLEKMKQLERGLQAKERLRK